MLFPLLRLFDRTRMLDPEEEDDPLAALALALARFLLLNRDPLSIVMGVLCCCLALIGVVGNGQFWENLPSKRNISVVRQLLNDKWRTSEEDERPSSAPPASH